MDRDELIDQIMSEMDRVWGDEGFGGESQEYEWLQHHYGISEDEDVQWQNILNYQIDELEEDDLEDEEKMQFLENDDAVCKFLSEFLQKYQSNIITYLRDTSA
jgi:hypothetical protein